MFKLEWHPVMSWRLFFHMRYVDCFWTSRHKEKKKEDQVQLSTRVHLIKKKERKPVPKRMRP